MIRALQSMGVLRCVQPRHPHSVRALHIAGLADLIEADPVADPQLCKFRSQDRLRAKWQRPRPIVSIRNDKAEAAGPNTGDSAGHRSPRPATVIVLPRVPPALGGGKRLPASAPPSVSHLARS